MERISRISRAPSPGWNVAVRGHASALHGHGSRRHACIACPHAHWRVPYWIWLRNTVQHRATPCNAAQHRATCRNMSHRSSRRAHSLARRLGDTRRLGPATRAVRARGARGGARRAVQLCARLVGLAVRPSDTQRFGGGRVGSGRVRAHRACVRAR
eukprot:536231-Prymnesium_polylepis.1